MAEKAQEFVEDDEKEDEGEQIICEPLVYPDTAELDEQRRAYVLSYMGDISDIAGSAIVQNCQMIYEWLKDGTIPQAVKEVKFKQVKS